MRGARLLWEQAELERARRNFANSRRRLHAFHEHVKRTFPRGHAWPTAHGDALDAELDRECHGPATTARATDAHGTYLELCADCAARRTAVTAWAAKRHGASFGRQPVITRGWKRDGYVLELEAVQHVRQGAYVPLNVWFVP